MLKKLIVASFIASLFISCSGTSDKNFKPEEDTDYTFINHNIKAMPEPPAQETPISNEPVAQASKGFMEIKIGKQVWMAENLNVTKFRNGDPVLLARTEQEWANATEKKLPACCFYKNTPVSGYGMLYNFYAVNDPRVLAPEGWHIPDDQEWNKLRDFLGGEKAAGTKMKSSSAWKESSNGTNESGFNALPGGFCSFDGAFAFFGFHGRWWSSSENDLPYAWMCCLTNLNNNYQLASGPKEYGISVRCIKD